MAETMSFRHFDTERWGRKTKQKTKFFEFVNSPLRTQQKFEKKFPVMD